jgi:hypothetical protein
VGCKAQEQFERVAVAEDGMWAKAPLGGQVVAEKALNVLSKTGRS